MFTICLPAHPKVSSVGEGPLASHHVLGAWHIEDPESLPSAAMCRAPLECFAKMNSFEPPKRLTGSDVTSCPFHSSGSTERCPRSRSSQMAEPGFEPRQSPALRPPQCPSHKEFMRLHPAWTHHPAPGLWPWAQRATYNVPGAVNSTPTHYLP